MGGDNTKKVFTLADVSHHNTAKDCWLVIHNKCRAPMTHVGHRIRLQSKVLILDTIWKPEKSRQFPQFFVIDFFQVYDVTKFLEDHPGGDEVLISSTGKDASNDFDDIGHSTSAVAMMDEFYVGDIDSSTIPSKVDYTPPKQPHYNQDKTSEFIIRILQFLVPVLILGLAVGIRFYTKST
ncbi:unnamed protein product [Trifolium pratense]|uniref:Uncharacterized protein n=1 Tax=Trifolium pratense TaxID=57577 RepID=A0ACB0KEU5_TRIPR|nr:unnamed protein product [Trifolium pratense]